ncbi:MAG: ACP S-malonyltransferase [Chloroflexota bacterium]|nr:ACP S-malonyltransferase [Chloroflexota bacterium]
MSTAAFVFPGQGSQYVGMGRELAEAYRVAAATWEEADAALGEPLSQLAWLGDATVLDLTVNAQPAVLACSIAFLRALGAAREDSAASPSRPAFYAGHSMGQYSALVAAGVITLGDGLRLVRERGRLMQESAADGAMAAVIGMPDERLAELEAAGKAAGVFAVANRNAPGQVVVSGERAAVESASQEAKRLGARRVVMLPVSVAAHSPLMAPAAEGLRRAIAGVTFSDPAAALLANADARPLKTAEACRGELIEHLTRGVDWVAAVETMAAAGVARFLEIGPGKVLTGLIKRIVPEAEAWSVDDATRPGGPAAAPGRSAAATPA